MSGVGDADLRDFYDEDKKGDLKITGWSINVKWTDGTEENITDIPDDIAQSVDEYLTEIEKEKNDD